MAKFVKNNLGNFLVILVIFSLVTGWFFSGFPRIWQKPPIPPEIQEARAGSQEFTATDTWNAPSGVTSVDVECWGGGGGGGYASASKKSGGGGGGGGGYAKKLSIPVTPSTGYTVTVGLAGGSGAAGGNSSFTGNSSITITANGGSKGVNDGGAGGSGGSGSCTGGCSTGPYTGGSGYQGSSTVGGGGGGSGGTGSNGNSATSQTGATAVTGGGPGGNGGASGSDGSAPTSGPGGGGGGSGYRSGGPLTGGSGYNGKCILTWIAPPTGLINSAAQKTDGTGKVDISIEVDDADDDDTKAKIEYVANGACDFATPLDPTLEGPATAAFNDSGGAPDVNNANAYQVGSGTDTRIITSSGSNTVQFDWLSATDAPSGNGTYCIRLTVNDDTVDQTTPATQTLTIDNVAPTAPGNLTDGGKTSSSITLTFGSQTTETNFTDYKIYYKAGISGVTESDTEHDDPDLDYIDYNSTTNTTVSGLTADTDYVFNIWAYDTYGHKANATEVSIKTAAAPSLSFSIDSNSLDFGNLFPGTPITDKTSILTVTTNDTDGFNIKVSRNDNDTTLDRVGEAAVNITDQTAWNSTAPNSVLKANLANSGDVLAFRVKYTGTDSGNYNSTWWGSDDTDGNARFAGFPATPGDTIVYRGSASDPSTDSVVQYYIDVANSQKTGTYDGGVTYTATVN